MTGSQFQKTSRATSYSPRLKFNNQETCFQGPNRCFSEKQNIITPTMGAMTPVRSGKRRHQAIVSPVTTRSESSSPKTKLRSLSSPVRLASPTAPAGPSAVTASLALHDLLLKSGEGTKGVGNPLAVPKVSAEPPSPTLLPSPPKHWIEENAQCLAQKQQCRAVTQCLVSHLASSGILVSAQ